MLRDYNLSEMTDGKFYKATDMVKTDCGGCAGCHDCCTDMGDSVVLDPWDILHLTKGTGKSFQELLDESLIEMGVVDGVILPHIKMKNRVRTHVSVDVTSVASTREVMIASTSVATTSSASEATVAGMSEATIEGASTATIASASEVAISGAATVAISGASSAGKEDEIEQTVPEEICPFLNVEGRCAIHQHRPGFCRLFPLARYYEEDDFRYIFQIHECPHAGKVKVKVEKWLGIPKLRRYEEYIRKWHHFKRLVQERMVEADEQTAKVIGVLVIQNLFAQEYEEGSFYEAVEERMERLRAMFGLG